MGNNAAFTLFEASVLAVYDHGVLDKELLSDLMEPYRDTDIDRGGMIGTLSKKDKLDVIEIVIKTFGKEPPPKPQQPKDYRTWTDEQSRLNDEWLDRRRELFSDITRRFGW